MRRPLKVRPSVILGMLCMSLIFQSRAGATALTIAHYPDYKPYAYVDADGRSRGLLVDVWQLWAEKNNAALTFQPARLSRCLELVIKGEADIVIGLFQSAERAVFLDFSDPLIRNVDTYLYVKESLKAAAIEDLGGIPVGVIRDDFAEGFLRQQHAVLKRRAYPGSKEIIADAVNGKLTAFVLDSQNATYLLSQHNALTAFNPTARLYTQALRAGVRKGDGQLIKLINQGLRKITRAEREAVYARYGSFSPEPLIARYRYWFMGGAATLFAILLVVGFYSFRLRSRTVALARGRTRARTDDWQATIARGEGDTREFKSTLRWNLKTGKADKNLEYVVVKTVSAFLNSAGGSLFIGVADDGQLLGLESDYRSIQKRPNRDGFLLKLSSLISQAIGKEFHKFIKIEVRAVAGADVCRVTVTPADKPAIVKRKGNEAFYIRTSAASITLPRVCVAASPSTS